MTFDFGWLDRWLATHAGDLVDVRRRIHMHPELGRFEHATTGLVVDRLRTAGLAPRRLPVGTGLVCDIGSGAPVVALRADLDALPVQDGKDVDYRSRIDGVCHACGHDVHTTVLLGAGLALAAAGGPPAGTVRLVFQPAEELVPGGALDVLDAGELDGVSTIVALHCDPRLDAGFVGVRDGVVTAASDAVKVELAGPGGHTARPELTVDLVTALAHVATTVPRVLASQSDPAAPLSLVWGSIAAGSAGNVIPAVGTLRGTVRTWDSAVWERAHDLVVDAVTAAAATFGAAVTVGYQRGVPPVINVPEVVDTIRTGVAAALGPGAVVSTEPSMGGEDFGWYLQSVPGALARLGVRRPGGADGDLHRSTFDVDESAIAVGVRAMLGTAYAALRA